MIRRPFSATLVACASFVLVAVPSARAAVPVPGPPQVRPVAIVGAAIHPVSGPVIAEGTIVFAGGKIVAVGSSASVPAPADAERIEGRGKHVYPGFIDAFTQVGLNEVSSVRATVDSREIGPINPNARAQVAFNPESEVLPVTRSNGVLIVGAAPQGALLGGQVATMMLDGWTWEDMTLRAPAGMQVTWPSMLLVRDGRPEERQKEDRARALRALHEAFDDARAYRTAKLAAGRSAGIETDVRWEAMIPVLEGRVPLFVEAEEIHQIEAAVEFAAAESLKLVIVGGYDAADAGDLLRRHDVPVIIGGIHRLPRRRGDAYDAPYTLPERLRSAGVRFCLTNGGVWNERNLPYAAATAVAYGLPADAGLAAITLEAARILGVADRVGSLEPGKDATLIVTDGDPFEEPTAVERAWIGGRAVDLNDRHKTLNAKYEEKYRRFGADPGAPGGSRP
jgi:imidazolonepropionase-like amidohydrolase